MEIKNENGTIQTTTEPEKELSANDYIQAIEKLKENSVPRSEYEKKVAENKQLLETLVNGGTIDAEKVAASKKTSAEVAAELCKPHSNLDYAKLALEHREKCLEEGKPDPFIGQGLNYNAELPTDSADADQVAEMLQACIDESDGNPEIFRSLFQAHTKDVLPHRLKR